MMGQRKRIARKNTRARALFREFIGCCGIYIHARLAVIGADESMRAGIRQFLGAVAAIALTLHTVAWGTAPTPGLAAVDPFSVICHSGAAAPVEPTSDHSPLAPAQACDHCNLCSASAPPSPPEITTAAYVKPAQSSAIPRPIDNSRHEAVVGEAGLARGPPSFA